MQIQINSDRNIDGNETLAAGVGSIATLGLGGILLGTIAALAGWYIWA